MNSAPSFINDGILDHIFEDTLNPLGSSIIDIFGDLFSDPDQDSSLAGIAIVGNTANPVTEGIWQYSTEGGNTWLNVGTVSDDSSALVLSESSLIRFVAVEDYNGIPPELTVRALDDTYSGEFTNGTYRATVDTSVNGGTTAISASTSAITTSVISVEEFSLTRSFQNPTPTTDDFFGADVAISANRVLIGASGKDGIDDRDGAAYLFDATTGNLLNTFTHPTGAVGTRFGGAIDLDGDLVLIGASEDNTEGANAGAAYLYDLGINSRIDFLNPLYTGNDSFGESAAVDGDYVVIGAPDATRNGIDQSGAAYLFHTDGTFIREFDNPQVGNVFFGALVAIDEEYALIAASGNDTGGTDSGAAHLYHIPTGDRFDIYNPDIVSGAPTSDDRFGGGVAIDGNLFAVSAPKDDRSGTDSGVVHLFRVDTKELVHTFENPDPTNTSWFGGTAQDGIRIDGNNILISSVIDGSGGNSPGVTYLFDATTFELVEIFQSPDPNTGDRFGISVDIEDNKVVIGELFGDEGVTDSGAAYLFEINTPPIAINDVYSIQEGTTLTVAAVDGVLSNDEDPDGDTLTVFDFETKSSFGGTVSMNQDGSLNYTPATAFAGLDQFEYLISDGNGGTATGVVEIEVTTQNQRSAEVDYLTGMHTDEFNVSGNFRVSNASDDTHLDVQLTSIGIDFDRKENNQGKWIDIAPSNYDAIFWVDTNPNGLLDANEQTLPDLDPGTLGVQTNIVFGSDIDIGYQATFTENVPEKLRTSVSTTIFDRAKVFGVTETFNF